MWEDSDMDHGPTMDLGPMPASPREGNALAVSQNSITSSAVEDSMESSHSNVMNLDNDDDSVLTDEDIILEKAQSIASTEDVEQVVPTGSGSSESDLIEVSSVGTALPLDPDSKGKLKNRYVRPDGTIIDGKGLGRGRPGFKRAPRKSSTLSQELVRDDATSTSTSTPVSQPKPIQGKRKRKDSDVIRVADASDDDFEDDEEDDGLSSDSSPEYTPATSTTRSGRQSQKPPSIITETKTASPSVKRPALTQNKSSPSVKKHPKIKAKVYRGREQFALCEHCTRQQGPPGNVIVFCDACNKCWHQRCHEPRISKEIVADSKAEWFCSSCDKILHGKKKAKATPSTPTVPQTPTAIPPLQQLNMGPPMQMAMHMPMQMQMPSMPPQPLPPRYSLPLIPGMSLTLAQRKQYLNHLSREKLIEIVLGAANLAPNMPIFETPLHLVPQMTAQGYPVFLEPSQLPQNRGYSPYPPYAQHQLHPQQPQQQPQQHSQQQAHQPQLAARASMPPPPVPTPPPQPHDPRPVYSHPTAHITSKPNTNPPPPDLTVDDEGYFDDYDEMALIYPKAGEGAYDMALPPESGDLGIMLEGPDSVTFSHWVKGQGPMKTAVTTAAAKV